MCKIRLFKILNIIGRLIRLFRSAIIFKNMNDFIKILDEWFGQKAPKLPANAKGVIVKIAPYYAIYVVLTSILVTLEFFGFSALLMHYGQVLILPGAIMGGYPLLVINIIVLVLCALAVPGLFHRKASGWNYLFYVVLVNSVAQLLEFKIGGLIIYLVISFYILFQTKPFYFGGVSMMNSPKPNTPPQTPPQKV